MTGESIIRFGSFVAIFAVCALLETLSPKRALVCSKAKRWFTNLVIVALNPVSVRLFPVLPAGMAVLASQRQWGLLNNINFPGWLKIAAGVVVLDMIIYLQHVLFHATPALWRLHMVHHADLDLDVTTGLRFHPFEIIVSMCIKIAAVAALGTPALSVLIFEVALNGTTMFNHSNISIPGKLDRVLRLFVVTPDMHRVHHSVIIKETNSNYGFNFPWWDRIFGTYKAQPAEGHKDMTIGLSQFREASKLTLLRVLILPFTYDIGQIPINRH